MSAPTAPTGLEGPLMSPERGVRALSTRMEALAERAEAARSWAPLALGWTQLLQARAEVTEGEALTIASARARSTHQAPGPDGGPAACEADIARAGWPVLARCEDATKEGEAGEDSHGRWAAVWTDVLERERARPGHEPPHELRAFTRLMVETFGVGTTDDAPPPAWSATLEAAATCRLDALAGDSVEEDDPPRTIALAVCALAAAGAPGTPLRARIGRAWAEAAHDAARTRAAEGAVRAWARAQPKLEAVLESEAGLAWTGGAARTPQGSAPPGAGTVTIVLLGETRALTEKILDASAAHDAHVDPSGGEGTTRAPGLVRTRRRDGIACELVDAHPGACGGDSLTGSPDACAPHIAARLRRKGPTIVAIAIGAARVGAPDDALPQRAAALLGALGDSAAPLTLIASGTRPLAHAQLGGEADATAAARRMQALEAEPTALDALVAHESKAPLEQAVAGVRALAGRDSAREAWIAALRGRERLLETIARHGARAVDGVLVDDCAETDTGADVAALWALWWRRGVPEHTACRQWVAQQLGPGLERDLERARAALPGDLLEALPRTALNARWRRMKSGLQAAHDPLRHTAWRWWRGGTTTPEKIVEALRKGGRALAPSARDAHELIESAQQCEETLRTQVKRHLEGALRGLGIDPGKRVATLLAQAPAPARAAHRDGTASAQGTAACDGTRQEEDAMAGTTVRALLEEHARDTARDAVVALAQGVHGESAVEGALRMLADTEPCFDALARPSDVPDPLKETSLKGVDSEPRTAAIIEAVMALLEVWREIERAGGLAAHARTSTWLEALMIACAESGFSTEAWDRDLRNVDTAADASAGEAAWVKIRKQLHECEEQVLLAQRQHSVLARVGAALRRSGAGGGDGGLKPWETSLKKAAASVAEYGAEIVQRRTGYMNADLFRETLAGLRVAIGLVEGIERQARAGRALPLPRPSWISRLNTLDRALRAADGATHGARQRLEQDLLQERAARARQLVASKRDRDRAAEIGRSLAAPHAGAPWGQRREAALEAIKALGASVRGGDDRTER